MPHRQETSIYQLPLELTRSGKESIHGYQIRTGILTSHRPREPLIDRALWEIPDRVQLHSPADAANHLMERIYTPWEQCQQEELWVLLLNTSHVITHETMAYRGTVNTIGNVRIAEIFRPAVLVNSPALLLAHNHPSGSCEPSPQDIRTTTLIREGGELLDIEVIDHLIIGKGKFISLKERGWTLNE